MEANQAGDFSPSALRALGFFYASKVQILAELEFSNGGRQAIQAAIQLPVSLINLAL